MSLPRFSAAKCLSEAIGVHNRYRLKKQPGESAGRKRLLITFLQPLWYGQPKSENKILRETRKGNSRFGTRGLKEGICTDYTKYTGNTVIIKPKNMTADQLQAGYNRFTRDYYKIMEIVYRSLKQTNAVAKITGLISNVTHRLNCMPGK